MLTNFASNNAAAAIGTPIAASNTHCLGAAPEPFVFAILFGANFCCAKPTAHQTSLMIVNRSLFSRDRRRS